MPHPGYRCGPGLCRLRLSGYRRSRPSGKTRLAEGDRPKDFDVTIGASPVLYDDTVLMICDKVGGKSSLIAFDRRSGGVKWEQKRPEVGFAHSTPVLTQVRGKMQMLVAASNALQGLDPVTGMVLWTCAARGDTASPVLGGDIVFCDSGRGGPGTAVDPTGTGDVTKTHLKWKKEVPEGFSSPIVVGDYIYRLHNPGLVTCWKLATGEEVYKERLQGITSTAASPIATPEGRIYFASAGKSYVLQAGPVIKVLAINDLGDPCHASPAVSDGMIILKGSKFLYCICTGNKSTLNPALVAARRLGARDQGIADDRENRLWRSVRHRSRSLDRHCLYRSQRPRVVPYDGPRQDLAIDGREFPERSHRVAWLPDDRSDRQEQAYGVGFRLRRPHRRQFRRWQDVEFHERTLIPY